MFYIYSPEASLTPSKIVSWPLQTFEFATTNKAEIPSKTEEEVAFSFCNCLLPLLLHPLHPWPHWASLLALGCQTFPTRQAHPQWSQDNALDSTLALTLYLYQNFSGLHPIPFCFGSVLCCFGQETTH